MPEQGPTEEEITAFLAGSDISLNMKRGFVRAALARIEPLTRARHVREAVKGLTDTWIEEMGDVQPLETDCFVLTDEQRRQQRASNVAAFRAALLAALTEEK